MRDPDFSLINHTISQSGQFHYGSITTGYFSANKIYNCRFVKHFYFKPQNWQKVGGV